MFGRYIWERYMLRVKVLEEWQRMLIEINGEINYSAQSMSQICRQMSKTSVYGKKFWDGIAKKTEERNAGLPGEFWREHLREYRYIELLSNSANFSHGTSKYQKTAANYYNRTKFGSTVF